ncbi:MAG TPA: zinc dependent phospholipase C family protein [Dehalococcoidia bacterium]|nr:zinc dependent phospholipase C family protein [Dehalococcoidia bacterium]
MPPLAMHTAIAKEIADAIRDSHLDDERGALYLGSTAPDIRIITRWDRKLTHFFDLSNFEEQNGVRALFGKHPELAQPAKLQPQSISFVAGYLTHLVMDETWINQVYRPCFGEHSPMGGDIRASIMDRALQYELDRARREDRPLIEHILNAIAKVDLGLDIGFLDEGTLSRWREVVLDVVNHPPDWERFRYVASRHLQQPISDDEEAVAMVEFMRDLPSLVEETVRYLTPERIDAFLEVSKKEGTGAVREYLCA